MEQTDIGSRNRISVGGNRGFVTIATGDYYCRLAINLVISYRVFSSQQYPFCVITSKDYVNKLFPYFDQVIVVDNLTCSFLDKIYIYDNSPFDETIFIDADSNITGDVEWLFDEFENNHADISTIGGLVDISKDNRRHLFSEKTVNLFNLKKDIRMNGGIYYFRKTLQANECINFMLNDLLPNYCSYGLDLAGGTRKHDEPLFILGMLLFGMNPLTDHRKIMRPLYENPASLSWNIRKREYYFLDYGDKISPVILHWMTNNTYSYKYVYYNSLIRSKFYKNNYIKTKWIVLCDVIEFFFTYKLSPWVKSHFCREYFISLKNRFTRLLGTR